MCCSRSLFRVPRALLPEARPSAGDFGATRGVPGIPDGVPIRGVAGDQQAALFGQGCVAAGGLKNTYGTEFTTPDGAPYNPDFVQLAQSFGMQGARVEEPGELEAALKKAFAANVPYLLEVRTRGDVPMPRTGYWDIADFLVTGND